MHKIANRQLRGESQKMEGVVLDNQLAPANDPYTREQILHHVYCPGASTIYRMTAQVHHDVVKEVDRNRPNDAHRKINENLKVGENFCDHIYFKHTWKTNMIVDFERAVTGEDTETVNGKHVFLSSTVFHPRLDRIYTEHFHEFPLPKGVLKRLQQTPTPNVDIRCQLGFEITPQLEIRPHLHGILEVNGEDQSFVMKAPWNRNKPRQTTGRDPYESDEDVQYEVDLKMNVGAITKQHAFITGLTSVYLVDMPAVAGILPKYEESKDIIGHEAKVDLIFSDELQCYVVFGMKERRSCSYRTSIRKLPNDDVHAEFDINVYAGESTGGFYKHAQFNFIADPHGYLDIAHVCGTKHGLPLDSRDGRLQVAGPPGDQRQWELVNAIRCFEIPHEIKGVVLDADECLVYSRIYANAVIRLPEHHPFNTGQVVAFRCFRVHEVDVTVPTFQVDEHTCRATDDRIDFNGQQFTTTASYNAVQNCWETSYFGFVPSADAEKPRRPKIADQTYPYVITAVRNTEDGAQTVLHKGAFKCEATPKRKY
ncbi:hypothetical protein M3Y99_01468000 [Aphelenchoides fujianensis]|nr:hypothetical protein M3Y99_01468000 [Aphelenchoides fujianensis]